MLNYRGLSIFILIHRTSRKLISFKYHSKVIVHGNNSVSCATHPEASRFSVTVLFNLNETQAQVDISRKILTNHVILGSIGSYYI